MSLTVARAVPFLRRTRTIRDDSIERRTRGRCSRHRLARWWRRRRLLLVVAAATGLGDGVQRGQRALEVAQREHVAPYRVQPTAGASTTTYAAESYERRDGTERPTRDMQSRTAAGRYAQWQPSDTWHRWTDWRGPGGTGTRTRIDSASAATLANGRECSSGCAVYHEIGPRHGPSPPKCDSAHGSQRGQRRWESESECECEAGTTLLVRRHAKSQHEPIEWRYLAEPR